MLIDAVAYQRSGSLPIARASRAYASAIAMHTPWQSSRVAMIPPLRTWRGPAAYSARGCHSATATLPSWSQWLLSWSPSGLSAPQPQQKFSGIWSWNASSAMGRRSVDAVDDVHARDRHTVAEGARRGVLGA